ncbi:hypothetical protein [Streptomyces noursei]|uniref:hypothetical protein n=1 Tax=Streptomyces noursei TaxID=1971 RepID=UPI003815F0E9
MELTDGEVSFMSDLLTEWSDDFRHHPNDFTDSDESAYRSLSEKVRAEAKRRGFWWAR